MREGKDFCRIGKRNGPLAWGVPGSKKVDEQRDKSDVSLAALRNQVAEAGSKKSPRHLGEGKQQKCSSAKSIDSPDSRPGKDEVDETKAHRSQQRLSVVSTSLLKDGAGVESYDVDYTVLKACFSTKTTLLLTSTHLLGNHHGSRCYRSPTKSGNGEQLCKSGDVVVSNRVRPSLSPKLSVNIIKVARSLQLRVSKALQ